jgi:membrane-bound inhibitor of C-type lysozyme
VQDRALNRVIRTVYLCNNGERLSVDFDNPRQMATVRNSNGEAVDLFQERAADGIWYRASAYELRGKGVMATWTADGRSRPTAARWTRRSRPAARPAASRTDLGPVVIQNGELRRVADAAGPGDLVLAQDALVAGAQLADGGLAGGVDGVGDDLDPDRAGVEGMASSRRLQAGLTAPPRASGR